MKRLLAENLKAAEIDDKILVEFIHTLLIPKHKEEATDDIREKGERG
jgi:hypothetical protein